MKILTVRQPWTWALVFGPKRIENRTWATRYRGDVAIHASANPEFRKTWRARGPDWWRDLIPGCPEPDAMPYGCIIGTLELIDCVELQNLPDELLGDRFASGPYCWLLDRPEPLLEPIACRGVLGLRDVPDGLALERTTRIDADAIRAHNLVTQC